MVTKCRVKTPCSVVELEVLGGTARPQREQRNGREQARHAIPS